MSEKKKILGVSQGIIVLVGGIVFILIGLTLILIFPPKTLLWKILFGGITEIGFAGVIAWCVAFIIEKSAREDYDRYTQEKARLISKNVFGFLYGVHLPKKVFAVLETHLFKPKVSKTSQKLEYELQLPDEINSEWLKMRCEYDYVLQNLSDELIKNHPVKFYVSDPTDSSAPEMEGLGLQSLTIGDENVDKSDFDDLDKAAANGDGTRQYEKLVDILPNGSVRVRVTFFQAKRIMDNDLYQTSCITEDFELKLRYDPAAFDVYIEPVHAVSKFNRDIPAHDGSHCRTVSIDTTLLPGNGVFMWWKYKLSGKSKEIEP